MNGSHGTKRPRPSAESGAATPSSGPKKRGRKQFWVVKVPEWLAAEWWDDSKYPEGEVLGMIESSKAPPKGSVGSSGNQMHLRVAPTEREKRTPGVVSTVPRSFTLEHRKVKERVNVRHGELHKTGNDRMLLFREQAAFLVDDQVEASRDNTQKQWPAIVRKVHAERVYDIQFDGPLRDGKYQGRWRKEVQERDMRLLSKARIQGRPVPQDRCMKLGRVHVYMHAIPDRTSASYQEFLRKRALTATAKKKTQLMGAEALRQRKEQIEAESASKAFRNSHVQSISLSEIGPNRRKLASGKTGKRVRKEESVYKTMIFEAFAAMPQMSQGQLEERTKEPWSFLREVVQKYCEHQGRGAQGRTWTLKSEYRLASDRG